RADRCMARVTVDTPVGADSTSLRGSPAQDPHHSGPLLPTAPCPLPGRRGRTACKDMRARENAPTEYPSPGAVDGAVGRGAGVRVLRGGNSQTSQVSAYWGRSRRVEENLASRLLLEWVQV